MFGGSSSNPFVLNENTLNDGFYRNIGYRDITSTVYGIKTLRSSEINTLQNNLILITCGDSNMGGVGPTGFTPINSNIFNFNIYDGATYSCADPLLGCTTSALGPGGISGRLADLISFGGLYNNIYIVSVAVGGSTTGLWAPGGILYTRLPIAIKRLAQRGITPVGTTTFAMVFQIGANEHGVSSSVFAANVSNCVAAAKDAGFSGKIFIPTYSILNNAVDAGVTGGQALLIDSINYFAGGNIDVLTGSVYRQADGTHLTTQGQTSAATTIYNAMHATGQF